MKNLCFVFLILISTNLHAAQDFTRLILVRHAEKALNQSKNPALSEKGKLRAEALKGLLEIFDIKAVYTSKYLRTKQTAKPLADEANLEINSDIGASDYDSLKDHIQSFYKKENILVVGHGNTVPAFINFLHEEEKYTSLDEDEFNKIFFVEIYEDKVESYKLSFEVRNGRISIRRGDK